MAKTLKICRKCDKPPKTKREGKGLSGKKLITYMASLETGYAVESCGCMEKCKKGPIAVLTDSKKVIKYATPDKILRKLETCRKTS